MIVERVSDGLNQTIFAGDGILAGQIPGYLNQHFLIQIETFDRVTLVANFVALVIDLVETITEISRCRIRIEILGIVIFKLIQDVV